MNAPGKPGTTPSQIQSSAAKTPADKPLYNATDVFNDILSTFGSGSRKADRRSAKPAKKAPPAPLPVGQAFNLKKTGYITWKAKARIIRFCYQHCQCGAEHLVNTGEFYLLENNTTHASWLRPEGYDISCPADLPIQQLIEDEIRPITCCSECISTADIDRLIMSEKQLELPL